MNTSAEKHLAKAQDYLERGDGFYHKAAAEMRAAKNEGATWPEIGDRLGRSKSWCQKIVVWAEIPANSASVPTPFAEPEREKTDVRGTKRVLSEAPLEQVEQIISELPPERQKAVAAAAGHEYLRVRQNYEEDERRKSPAQRKHEEAAVSGITEAGRRASGGFLSLGIAGHIEQAAEELRELIADGSITAQNLEPITASLRELIQEYEVACAMAGLESDLELVRP